MDELAAYNKARWEELSAANVMFSRPWLDLDGDSARQRIDPEGLLGDLNGKEVLCLAGGGGQQSAAFSLLGANVTVFDLSETQLRKDREAAAHYGITIRTLQGDMRDLSVFADDAFDCVWHAHSINFVPDARAVFAEAARALRPGGVYRLGCHNPYLHGVCEDDWNGEGYVLKRPYVDGEVHYATPEWDFEDDQGAVRRVVGPKEFRHPLATLVNSLVECGFLVRRVSERTAQNSEAVPGSWDHLQTVTASYIDFWLMYRPDVQFA